MPSITRRNCRLEAIIQRNMARSPFYAPARRLICRSSFAKKFHAVEQRGAHRHDRSAERRSVVKHGRVAHYAIDPDALPLECERLLADVNPGRAVRVVVQRAVRDDLLAVLRASELQLDAHALVEGQAMVPA